MLRFTFIWAEITKIPAVGAVTDFERTSVKVDSSNASGVPVFVVARPSWFARRPLSASALVAVPALVAVVAVLALVAVSALVALSARPAVATERPGAACAICWSAIDFTFDLVILLAVRPGAAIAVPPSASTRGAAAANIAGDGCYECSIASQCLR